MHLNFAIEPRGDGGIRIYATQPTGLYVSSRSTYAAAEYFQRLMVVVAMDNIEIPEDGGVELLSEIDWEDLTAKGGGFFEFGPMTSEELAAEEDDDVLTDHTLDGDFPPMPDEESTMAKVELEVERRVKGSKNYFVAYDPADPDPVLEQIILRQETMQ